MQIQQFTFNPFQTNSYICYDAGEAVIIDASCSTEEEIRSVEQFVAEENLTVQHLLLTHAHIDHILGCRRLSETYGMGFKLHRDEEQLLEHAQRQGEMFGVKVEQPPSPAGFLNEGDTVTFGTTTLEVIHAPGHSPGSICFFDAKSMAVISGDVLFQGSIGRTDLWRGSLPELMESIFQKIVPLGDDVRVYPGHGPETTVREERQKNPFLTRGSPSFER